MIHLFDLFIVYLKRPLWQKLVLAFLVGAVFGLLSKIF